MPPSLSGKTVAILATDGFEQVELTEPMKALKAAGATVEIVSLKSGEIQGFNHFDKGDTFRVDRTLDETDPSRYEALMLPGGAHNPDQLRVEDKALAFVRAFFDASKPVAAICHAPWLLIDAGVAEGRVADFAQDVKACALGQATAAIVGEAVIGASVEELETARDQLKAMLKANGPAPTGRFSGLAILETVRDYPARHASTMIPLEAAAAAARQAFEQVARPDAKPDSTFAGRARDRTRLAGAA